jgi:hypothetical protein
VVVVRRKVARDDDGANSPTKMTAFTVTATIPGIGVVAILTNRSPTTIHTTQ